jgi:hypothetical protein
MKKILLGLIATVLLSFGANAQTGKADLEKMFGSLTSHEVSEEILGKSEGLANDQIFPFYIASQKGWFIIVGNNSGAVKMYTTANLKLNGDLNVILTGKRQHHDCDDKPSDWGVALCAVGTLVEGVFCYFSGC